MDLLRNPISPVEGLIGIPIPQGGALERGASAEKAAKDFESVLLNNLLNEMNKTIPKSGLFDNGISEQIQGIFWYYLAQDLADKGGIGIWKEISRQMEGSTNTTPATDGVELIP